MEGRTMKNINKLKTFEFYLATTVIVAWMIVLGPTAARAQSTNVIFGCYNKSDGTLRRVNSGSDCKNSEISISWNIQGLQGLQGPQGVKGDRGVQGLQGVKGDQGVQGPKGDQGIQGLKGDQGVQGQKGDQGTQGLRGDLGLKGDKGDAGQSVTGLDIAPGAECVNGGVMYTSADGNHLVCNGLQGPKGDTGAQGLPGDSAGSAAGGLFGDGSDGDVTITGPTTLTRDMYYHDLTINAGQTLNPGGFRIFVSGNLTFDAGGGASISRNGPGGCSGTGCESTSLAAGTLGGTAGSASLRNSLGGSGGSGTGFFGDTTLPPTATSGGRGVFRSATQAISGRSLDGSLVNGGGGGGFGTINGAITGSGGGGGGVVVVTARTIVFNGSEALISAAGGTGANTGGGGGGGGVVIVITTTPQPAGLNISAIGGGGSGGGHNGADGFTAWLN
jgi:hypothetical protein